MSWLNAAASARNRRGIPGTRPLNGAVDRCSLKRNTHTIQANRKTTLRVVATAVFVVALGTIVPRAQVPLEVGGRDRSGSLPEGEGRQLVLSTCTQCHSLGPLVLQRKTAAGWRATTKDMISRGA